MRGLLQGRQLALHSVYKMLSCPLDPFMLIIEQLLQTLNKIATGQSVCPVAAQQLLQAEVNMAQLHGTLLRLS